MVNSTSDTTKHTYQDEDQYSTKQSISCFLISEESHRALRVLFEK